MNIVWIEKHGAMISALEDSKTFRAAPCADRVA
jgi:hypothetical protein